MKLVIVSESFGADTGIAGLRIGNFVKHLSRRGVFTLVVSGTQNSEPEEVPLQAVIPGLAASASAAALERIRESRVARIPSRIDPPRLAPQLQQRFPSGSEGRLSWLGVGVRKLASAHAFYTFGEHQGWVRRAIAHAERVARRERVDAVMATFGSEYWNFEVAHVLGKRLRVPVILDVRDEWDRFFGAQGRRSLIYPLMHRYFSACALSVCATESVAVRLKQFWPKTPTAVIHNGFDLDEEEMPATDSAYESNGPLVLGHIGTFWENEHWPKFADAIAQLGKARQVRVVYRGRNPEMFRAALVSRSYPPGVTFDIAGMVPRAASLELVRQAHVSLVAVPVDSQGAVPAKMFDPIALCKPLLVLGDRAPAYLVDYLSHCPSPWLVTDSATSVGAIAEYLEQAPTRRVDAPERRLKYSARARADELYEILDRLLANSSRTRGGSQRR